MNKRVYELQAGDAFFIPPGVEAWYEADREDPGVICGVGFVGIKADECMSGAGFSEKSCQKSSLCQRGRWVY